MKLTESQIANELHAMRPLPEPAFAAELDEDAASRFGRLNNAPSLLRRLRAVPPRRLVPVVGAVAALIVVAGIALSRTSPDGKVGDVLTHGGAEGGAVKTGAAPAAAPAAQATSGRERPVQPGAEVMSLPAPRDVARNASMTLSTAPDQVADVAAGVSDVVDRYHGFILNSSIHTSDSGSSGGTLELRIPTAKLQSALADLTSLAHVSARDDGTIDITAQTNSTHEQVAELEKQLAAEPTNETIRAALDAQRDLLRRLEARVKFTPVSVTIRGDRATGGSWSIGDAAHDAGSVLRSIAGGTLVSLAVLVPLALLAALVWVATRAWRRHARERALD
jgi:hypothetical protein